MSILDKHGFIERNATVLLVATLVTVSIGGLVEIAPLFYIQNTIEKVEGVRPYTPLELKGRDIYIREGCYLCHSQMIRPMRDEVERYGHYSLAAESMYDRPFQWGSKRTGPDLARVGGRYSDQWHVDHMWNPRDLVPESIMPAYPHLIETTLDFDYVGDHLLANQRLGVPYDDDAVSEARLDVLAQLDPDGDRYDALLERYPGANIRNFDGRAEITELDALIAYLQVLGTMVDFSTYEVDPSR